MCHSDRYRAIGDVPYIHPPPAAGFKDYWYQSAGQPSALMQHLCSHVLDDPAQYGQPRALSLDEFSASQPLQSLSLDSLLVQTGYLTIKKVLVPGIAEVGYPNEEVSRAMARLFADVGHPSNGRPALRSEAPGPVASSSRPDVLS